MMEVESTDHRRVTVRPAKVVETGRAYRFANRSRRAKLCKGQVVARALWVGGLDLGRGISGGKKGKDSPYSITKRRVPELIPVLIDQPAGDVSHKPGGRLR